MNQFQTFFPAGPLGAPALMQQLGLLQQQQSLRPVILRAPNPPVVTDPSIPLPGAEDPPTTVITQSTIAMLWMLNHNLGTFPSVTTVDPSGRVILGEVAYLSDNVITVAFSQPVSGNAYLNV